MFLRRCLCTHKHVLIFSDQSFLYNKEINFVCQGLRQLDGLTLPYVGYLYDVITFVGIKFVLGLTAGPNIVVVGFEKNVGAERDQ